MPTTIQNAYNMAFPRKRLLRREEHPCPASVTTACKETLCVFCEDDMHRKLARNVLRTAIAEFSEIDAGE